MKLRKFLVTGLTALALSGCAAQNKISPFNQWKSSYGYDSRWYEGIQITGPQYYIYTMRHALDNINKKDPQNWVLVKNNITHIILDPPSRVDVKTGIFSTDDFNSRDYFAWIVSEIIHDACHVELYKRGFEYTGESAEWFCLGIQTTSLRRNGYLKIDLTESFNKRYWKPSLEERKH